MRNEQLERRNIRQPLVKSQPVELRQPDSSSDSTEALVREIAMDIGKEVAHHIEIMYPDAVKATSRNMLLSVRNCVFNEIVAAIKVNDEGEIIARLANRKKFRRKAKTFWRKMRK